MAESVLRSPSIETSLHPRPSELSDAYSLRHRRAWAAFAVAGALLLAGFWNPRAVDAFGRDVVAGATLGDPDALSTTFAQNGFGFGFLFAAIAGLAATFTACNCVVFAMLPGLAASGRAGSRRSALTALGIFTLGVIGIGAVYGVFIGFLGPRGIEAFNTREVRLAQANTVFSAIGGVMLLWGALEFGFLAGLRRHVSPLAREFFTQPTTKAGVMGLMVGAFAIGRPFPVMRDFLVYAAAAHNPLYGASVMMIQGLGQIAVMVALFLILVFGLGSRLTRWVTTKPQQVALTSAMALTAGGTFFVFYWGLAFVFNVGRWGFRLGWY